MADMDPLDTDSMPFLVSSSEVSPDDSMPSLEVLPESEESDDSVYTALPYVGLPWSVLLVAGPRASISWSQTQAVAITRRG